MTTRTDFAKYLTRFLSEYLPHQRNVGKNTIASYRDSFVQFHQLYERNQWNTR